MRQRGVHPWFCLLPDSLVSCHNMKGSKKHESTAGWSHLHASLWNRDQVPELQSDPKSQSELFSFSPELSPSNCCLQCYNQRVMEDLWYTEGLLGVSINQGSYQHLSRGGGACRPLTADSSHYVCLPSWKNGSFLGDPFRFWERRPCTPQLHPTLLKTGREITAHALQETCWMQQPAMEMGCRKRGHVLPNI